MSDRDATKTSANLLCRLRQESVDPAGWAEFVRRYGPDIYGWCRRWKLQEADTDDVAQTVSVKLVGKIRTLRAVN